MKTLPNLPSALLNLALDDLELVEKNPAYTIDMMAWHRPNAKTCSVCLAGSVIAVSLGKKPTSNVMIGDLSGSDRRKLLALNAMRSGLPCLALRYLDIDKTDAAREYMTSKTYGSITPYIINKAAFKSELRELAAELEKAGL